MSSYLSIYVKPKKSDEKILLFSVSRNSDLYQFFYENNLSGYAYSNEDNKEQFYKLDKTSYLNAIQDLREEISKNKDKLSLMKSLKDKATIEDIVSYQEYVDDKIQLLHELNFLSYMYDQDYDGIKDIYTNYD